MFLRTSSQFTVYRDASLIAAKVLASTRHAASVPLGTHLKHFAIWHTIWLNPRCFPKISHSPSEPGIVAATPTPPMTAELCLHGHTCSAAVRRAVRRPISGQRTLRCGHIAHRHVLVALHLRQRNRKRPASCITKCMQSTTAELEDIDPLTGAVLTPVKSKVPKYDRSLRFHAYF